jgi:hypothetical protein
MNLLDCLFTPGTCLLLQSCHSFPDYLLVRKLLYGKRGVPQFRVVLVVRVHMLKAEMHGRQRIQSVTPELRRIRSRKARL